nr:hypothetical protein GCM10025699_17460 [Microbacterium flavescens]
MPGAGAFGRSRQASHQQTPRVRASGRVSADARDGRDARARAPRRAAGSWDSSRREMPALDRLRAQEAVRDQDLLPLRYARMASSRWAYLRGAAAVMAADLASTPHSGLTVQMCGDAHILNFGYWASPERQLLFDVRDFDETLPGPFEWDLKRLTTSIHVLADSEESMPRAARSRLQPPSTATARRCAAMRAWRSWRSGTTGSLQTSR